MAGIRAATGSLVARQRAWSLRDITPAIFASLLIVLSAVLAVVWVRVQVVELRFDLGTRVEERDALRAERDRLRLDMQRLKTPARIESIARKSLGLQSPTPDQLRTLVPLEQEMSSPMGDGAPDSVAVRVAGQGE